jgi:hypothetical protein
MPLRRVRLQRGARLRDGVRVSEERRENASETKRGLHACFKPVRPGGVGNRAARPPESGLGVRLRKSQSSAHAMGNREVDYVLGCAETLGCG